MKKVRAPMRPTLSLTPDDTRELRALSDDLERELLRAYDEFRHRHNGQVDPQRWKHVKSQEDLHIYRERSAFRQASHSISDRPKTSDMHDMEIGPQAALAANSKKPVLLGTGTLPGSVLDALYGSSFHDTRSLRARNSYAGETMEENAVLGIIDGPSLDDPFRFLGVIWYYKVFPIPGLLASRDTLMLTSMHLATLDSGECVAVTLYHSINHRDAPDRRDLHIYRAEVSIAMIYRQIDDLRFEVFMTSFVNFKGAPPELLVSLDSARSLLTVTNVCDVALRRKLFFRIRERQLNRQHSTSSAASSVKDDDRECALCNKKLNTLFSSSGCNCQICGKRVCPKCCVTKDIVIESHRTAYTAKPFDFCLVCTLDTKEIPALTIARDELYERSLVPRNPLASSDSSISSGSI